MEHIHNTIPVPSEKSKMVSFGSAIMKHMVVFAFWSRFAIKLICCIAFGSESSALLFT